MGFDLRKRSVVGSGTGSTRAFWRSSRAWTVAKVGISREPGGSWFFTAIEDA